MREKIYTIPVMDGFNIDSECPLCVMKNVLEEKLTGYFVSGAHMEVDGRQETNELGFCREHFIRVFESQKNTLGVGLILDTYMQKYNQEFSGLCQDLVSELETQKRSNGVKRKMDSVTEYIHKRDGQCAVCKRVDGTMEDYIRTVMYLWEEEPEFQRLFISKKGFCIQHFELLMRGAVKYLPQKKANAFCLELLGMQQENLKRIQEEVNWFTLKADYRNDDKPWGNSKDAVKRGIAKLKGKIE